MQPAEKQSGEGKLPDAVAISVSDCPEVADQALERNDAQGVRRAHEKIRRALRSHYGISLSFASRAGQERSKRNRQRLAEVLRLGEQAAENEQAEADWNAIDAADERARQERQERNAARVGGIRRAAPAERPGAAVNTTESTAATSEAAEKTSMPARTSEAVESAEKDRPKRSLLSRERIAADLAERERRENQRNANELEENIERSRRMAQQSGPSNLEELERRAQEREEAQRRKETGAFPQSADEAASRPISEVVRGDAEEIREKLKKYASSIGLEVPWADGDFTPAQVAELAQRVKATREPDATPERKRALLRAGANLSALVRSIETKRARLAKSLDKANARADEAARRAEQERSKQKAAPKPGRRISLVRDKAKTSDAPAAAETPEQRAAALAALPPKVRENIERPLTREEREAAGEDTRREGAESDANRESDFFDALDNPEPGSSVFNALAQYVFDARTGTNGANLKLEGMLEFVRHPRTLASVIPVLTALEQDARGLPSGRVGKFAEAFRAKWQDATGTRWGSPEAERVRALLPGGGRPTPLSEGNFFGEGQMAAAQNAAGMSDAEMFDRVLAGVLAPNGLRLGYDPASDKAAQQRLAAQRARNPFASNRRAVSEAEQARQASDESMDAEREADRSLGLGPAEEETSNRYDLGDMDDGAMYSGARTAAAIDALPDGTSQETRDGIARVMERAASDPDFIRNLPTQKDRDYVDAIARGDWRTAQKMVREAAARAMPNTKVLDKDGLPKIVFHGTPNKRFNVFDENRVGNTNRLTFVLTQAA